MKVPVICMKCGQKGSLPTTKLGAKLKCKCGSDDIDVYEPEVRTAARPDDLEWAAWQNRNSGPVGQYEMADGSIKHVPKQEQDRFEKDNPDASLVGSQNYPPDKTGSLDSIFSSLIMAEYGDYGTSRVDIGSGGEELARGGPVPTQSINPTPASPDAVQSVKQVARCSTCGHETEITFNDPAAPIPPCGLCGGPMSVAGPTFPATRPQDVPAQQEHFSAQASLSRQVKVNAITEHIVASNPSLQTKVAMAVAREAIERFPKVSP
jgi:hypothetical protein